MMVVWLAWPILLPAHAAERRTPIVEAVELATPAVVTIEVKAGRSRGEAQEGSGVIIRDDAVLTNAHVVAGAREVYVRLAGGDRKAADVLALDGDIDLAVLRVRDADPLAPISIGDSAALLLGETVIAIGNPLGLGLTVSTGVVGSTSRDVEIQPGLTQTFIQTDAAINPGNSGGALVDINGQLIGINTAIRVDAEGIGFAIPVNRAMKIADDMLDYGTVNAPWLGVDLRDTNLRGATLVTGLSPDGPAGSAGVLPGDLITEVDGHRIKSLDDLNARIAEQKPGDTVRLEVLRDRKRTTIDVVTTALPESAPADLVRTVLQVTLTVSRGQVKVEEATPGGLWLRAGLQVGDVISAVDGRTTPTVEEIHSMLQRALVLHRDQLELTIRRRGRVRRHTLRLRRA